jgi:histidinol dehydrogenase
VLGPAAMRLASAEGLEAHRRSVAVRLGPNAAGTPSGKEGA